jgi:hypothetical protein
MRRLVRVLRISALIVCPIVLAGCHGTSTEPPSAAIKLAFTTQPSSGYAGVALSAVQVVAQDVSGNTVNGYASTITMTIGTNPTGDTLAGTPAVVATAGVAYYSDLVLERIGRGYTLTATATGLASATSDTFNITGWATLTPMPTARSGLAAAMVNGVIYAMGGTSATGALLTTVEAYDTASNTWSTKAPMPVARSHLAAGVLGGKIYAVGGITGSGFTNELDIYDPGTNTWTSGPGMPSARADLGVGVAGGILYAVGGNATQPPSGVGEVEAYDPTANAWTVKPTLPTPRRDLAVAGVAGQVYALGGDPAMALGGPTVEAYNPAAGAWVSKPTLSLARAALSACESNGILYAVGGVTTGTTGMVQSFNPVSDTTWTQKAPMLTPRQYLGLACTGSSLYAVGGSLGAGSGPTGATEYFQP